MSDQISVDMSEVKTLAADLDRAPGKVIRAIPPVIAKGANNIKKDARRAVSKHSSWQRLAGTINYDFLGPFTAEIGYDDKGQGELAGIAEFGSARKAPHPALIPALAKEAPQFEAALLEVADKAMGL